MASTWGQSWAQAWGNSWGDIGLGFPAEQPAQPARRVKRYVDLSKQKAGFSRKYYDELMAAARAHEAALEAAYDLKTSKRKSALVEATKASDYVLSLLSQHEEAAHAGELLRMTAALEAASSATQVKDVIARARQAQAVANAIIADIEDEDEAVMLLLQ